MSIKQKIIIADPSLKTRTTLRDILEDTYDIIEATDGHSVLSQLQQDQGITAILMALELPHLDGRETTRMLKKNFLTFHLPVILLTDSPSLKMLDKAVDDGIDDYLQLPADADTLKARLLINIKRSKRTHHANPLTKLPGNEIIKKIMLERIKKPLAILYCDLDNFKPYNDRYGFQKGDFVLKNTAHILSEAVRTHDPHGFLGHIGGDDFIIITIPKYGEIIASDICMRFDGQITRHYNKRDADRKKITALDRYERIQEFPLMALSIAVVTNEKFDFTSTLHIAQLATSLKRYAKTKPSGTLGSSFVKE